MNAFELIREIADNADYEGKDAVVKVVINGETFDVDVRSSVTGEIEIHPN